MISFRAIENLDKSGVVVFNQEDLSISALPEAHHMTKHLIHLTTMVTLMKLDTKSSIYNVCFIILSLISHTILDRH
jgi:hypothetical protein